MTDKLYTESELSTMITRALSKSYEKDIFVTVSSGKVYIECDTPHVLNNLREYIKKETSLFPEGCENIMNGNKVVGIIHRVNEIQRNLLVTED